MTMVPLESQGNSPPNNLDTFWQREPSWIPLTMILAVLTGIIALCIYAV
jgi:hypothetical protein